MSTHNLCLDRSKKICIPCRHHFSLYKVDFFRGVHYMDLNTDMKGMLWIWRGLFIKLVYIGMFTLNN